MKLDKKDKEIFNLENAIESVHTIRCSKCNTIDQIVTPDSMDAAQFFLEHGWRSPKDNIYCPTCASKHVKSKI